MSEFICARCRTTGQLHSKEEERAMILADQAMKYADAVVERHASLAAAARFYNDLMVQQWRLDALDAQLQIIQASRNGGANSSTDEASFRQGVLDKCLAEIQIQHSAAVEALEERATNYALSAPASTCVIKRFAAGDVERETAIEEYRQMARQTYDELANGAYEILKAEVGDVGLSSLHSALTRRRVFWQGELEETWGGWHTATARMHHAGDIVIDMWKAIAKSLRTGVYAKSLRTGVQCPPLELPMLRASVVFAALGLEVELVNSLGFSGLVDEGHQGFSANVRVDLLTSVLDFLQKEGFLHEVGDLLLSRDATVGKAGAEQPNAVGLSLPTPTVHAAVCLASALEERTPRNSGYPGSATPTYRREYSSSNKVTPKGLSQASFFSNAEPGTPIGTPSTNGQLKNVYTSKAASTAASSGGSEREQEEEEKTKRLLPWLMECLVAAMRRAVDQGDVGKLGTLQSLCCYLGCDGLADTIHSVALRRQKSNTSGQPKRGMSRILTHESLESLPEEGNVASSLENSPENSPQNSALKVPGIRPVPRELIYTP